MSKTTKQINRITSTIILIAVRIIIIAAIAVFAVQGVKKAYEFGHSIFYETSVEEAPGRDVRITIPEGTDSKTAAKMLLEKGLIENEYAAIVQAKFFEYEVVPGTYTFNTSMTTRDILKMLNEGPEAEEENA